LLRQVPESILWDSLPACFVKQWVFHVVLVQRVCRALCLRYICVFLCRFAQHSNLTQTAAQVFLLQHVVKPIPKSMQRASKKLLHAIDCPLSCFELMMLSFF
jgi:hypothetical protein